MTSTVRIVCRPALVPGFALAGLQADSLEPDEDLESVWAGFARHPEVGVVDRKSVV